MIEQEVSSTDRFQTMQHRLHQAVRNVRDFPREGINFKDITPVLQDSKLCRDMLEQMARQVSHLTFDAVAGIESRGFMFGMLLAQHFNLPFIMLRKKGKLPFTTLHEDYALEYGKASLEVHADALPAGAKVLVHDDLLATGGTVEAACRLLAQLDARVEACTFILNLSFLNGKQRLAAYTSEIHSLLEYQS